MVFQGAVNVYGGDFGMELNAFTCFGFLVFVLFVLLLSPLLLGGDGIFGGRMFIEGIIDHPLAFFGLLG